MLWRLQAHENAPAFRCMCPLRNKEPNGEAPCDTSLKEKELANESAMTSGSLTPGHSRLLIVCKAMHHDQLFMHGVFEK